MKKHLFLLIWLLGLTACGFHLRGIIELPKWLDHIAIISPDGDKELVSILKNQLEGYDIQVNSDPACAQYWIIINHSTFRQQIVSVGASTNPRQYQLILTIEFMLQARKGPIIKAAQTVTVTRQLTVNNDRILGSNAEETILLREMKKDAALQILNRLSRP